MATLYPLQSILFGLMGWAATTLMIMEATRLTTNDRRAMVVCSWMLWMIPALGVLVQRGLLSTDAAARYCGVTTLGLAALVIVSSLRPRTRP